MARMAISQDNVGNHTHCAMDYWSMKTYTKGRTDYKAGRIPSWSDSINAEYMRGYNAAYMATYRPKRAWWWPF